ncbi:copper amine oxidase N-terminal domain-containing protein [Brevibacillus laterosporus]|uniref:copper amine oxidase N-terminal domain-containing protein n=1 Tax=Brevibacillus laterosporus TaxID=1465 RepID=UPI002654A61F|nr:copper amine oxidase N-terminal domain-containing protein [Brevibacillus laterosporus]MDN9008499.1 copper amine oxidase N-terminal domain-containing protein [Brevibacillus laterosporus]MDO0939584.1 copper amine oxidase N-terminal domain-containing protein [Brevibacillus laterosporus]
MFKKKALLVLSSALLIGALPATTDAAVVKKNVLASYNNVKVKYNGYEVPTSTEPFIVNGTTYIPVRMMAGVFNKNVDWDQASYTVSVTDREDPTVASLKAQLASKDSTIANLEKQLKDAKDDLARKDDKKSSDSDDLEDLEDKIRDKYEDWEDIDWDISLDGDEDDIEITIEFSMDDDEDLFNDRDKDDLKDFVTKICKMVWDDDAFEDADITGTITDSDDDDDLYDFEGKASSGKVTLTKN